MIKTSELSVFTVYFDGGGSCAFAYGSWSIWWNGFNRTMRRFKIQDHYHSALSPITSNISEYVSLIQALRWLRSVREKELYWVNIWGDSKLVVEQVKGGWDCRKPYLNDLRVQVRGLLKEFGGWSIRWHPRKESLSMFGH